ISCKKDDIAEDNNTPPVEEETDQIVVAKDGSGDFTSVQKAIDEVPDNSNDTTVIFRKNGIYKAVITIPECKTIIKQIGEDRDNVDITYDNYASKINPETGEEYVTSRSASTFVYASDFTAKNITFRNAAGDVGQALSIYLGSDRCRFINCKFIGFQDTIFTGGNGNSSQARQYFKNCYIEGATDFIFGGARAVFDNCTIFCVAGGYITAASTPSGVLYGYVFLDCTIKGTAPDESVLLGRPWRPYAKTVYINCYLSDVVDPKGWSDWGDPDKQLTALYAEYNSSGPGGDKVNQRVSWSEQLTSEQAEFYTLKNIIWNWYVQNL